MIHIRQKFKGTPNDNCERTSFPGPLIHTTKNDYSCYHKSQTAAAMDIDKDKDKECSPPRRCTGHQFDTSSNGMESSSPPLVGTNPPQVTDGHSPLYAIASSSSAKKWIDTYDESKDSPPYKNDKFVFSEDGIDRLAAGMEVVDHFAVNELMDHPSGPPLSSLKNEEETTSSGDSPPVNETQPSRDSPGTKSTGSSSSMDMWQTRFEELQKYKQMHGDFKVPQKYGPLGVWVNKQRNEYNKFEKGMKSQLTHERILQLNSVNFTRAKTYGQDLWELRFNELKEYKEKVSCDLSCSYCSIGCCPPSQSVYSLCFRIIIAT